LTKNILKKNIMPDEEENYQTQQQQPVQQPQPIEQPVREPFIDTTIYIERSLKPEELERK
jgi:hypothetical protein